MRWKKGRGRGQVIDRRGETPSGGLGGLGGILGRGGGGFPLPGGATGVGGGLVVVVILVLLYATGVLGGGSAGTPANAVGRVPGAPDPDADLVDFVGFVVDDVQGFWSQDFSQSGRTYESTKLVLFDGQTESGCGLASSDTGPFYCLVDHLVYLDLGFFQELTTRFRAPGDFAEAYVIAHEIGHHVQSLLGTQGRVQREIESHPADANELSVRLELQADCYAGVWAHSAYQQNELESGDLEEGLAAASAVGDDRVQRSVGERVNPETWTHGSSAQRAQWLKAGFSSGDPVDCDTFSGSI
jgi:predicted metalloprotease